MGEVVRPRRHSPSTLAYGSGREALLDATIRLVGGRGMAALTYRAVAEEANVTHGLVLHHFGSLDSLLEAALLRSVDQTVHEFATHEPAATPADFGRNFLARVLSNRTLYAFQYEAMLAASRNPALHAHLDRVHNAFRKAMRDELRSVGAPSDKALVELAYAAIDGVVFHLVAADDPKASDAAVSRLGKLLAQLVENQDPAES